MSIRRSTIFLLLAVSVLMDGDGLAVNDTDTEDKQWIDTNARDVNRPNGRSDLLPTFDESGGSVEAQKIPALLNRQETTCHRRVEDRGTSSGRMDCLIAALSKIAKIRSFEEDPASAGRDLTTNAARGSAYLRNGVSVKDTGASVLLDTEPSSKLLSNISDNSPGGIGQENFHCRAIRDVFIPEIKENVPSYACTAGSKTFILSSKRFFQDRRSSLRVHIGNDMLRELNGPAVTPASSRFNVIPAVLILKPGHENYDIRNQQSVTSRGQQTVDDKNIGRT